MQLDGPTDGARHFGTTVWVPPFQRHRLGAHRLGTGTSRHGDVWAPSRDIAINTVWKVRMISASMWSVIHVQIMRNFPEHLHRKQWSTSSLDNDNIRRQRCSSMHDKVRWQHATTMNDEGIWWRWCMITYNDAWQRWWWRSETLMRKWHTTRRKMTIHDGNVQWHHATANNDEWGQRWLLTATGSYCYRAGENRILPTYWWLRF